MSGEQIIYVDTETTGLSPDRNEVFEVGLIKDGKETVIWMPIDLSRADEDALRINRYYERQEDGFKKYGVDVKKGAWLVAELTSACSLAGCNIFFDSRMLRALLKSQGITPAWHYKNIDVTDVAAGALGLKHPWNSKNVAEALGLPKQADDDAHTAIGDARRARLIYETAIEIRAKGAREKTLAMALAKILKTDFADKDEQRVLETAQRWASQIVAGELPLPAPAKASA